MFDQVATILAHFDKSVTSIKVYSVHSFRIDIEDYVYIVETKDGAFILYETDYMFDVDEAIDVLKTVATENKYKYIDLLCPDTSGKDARILRIEGNSRIYLAAEIEVLEPNFHIDPTSYGSGTGNVN